MPTLEEFFSVFTLDQLVSMYQNYTEELAIQGVKEEIMKRLDMIDDDSFYVWLRLY